MKLFSLDGPFQKYGSLLFDLMGLSVLWFLLSLFSVGLLLPLATVALFYAMHHAVINDEGYAFKSFFRILKTRFVRCIPVTLIFYFGYILTISNVYFVLTGVFNVPWLLPIYLFMLLELTLVFTYIFPLMAETELKLKPLFKYAFMLSNKHLVVSVICVAITVGMLLAIYLVANPFILAIVMSVVVYAQAWLINKKVLIKYYFDSNASV